MSQYNSNNSHWIRNAGAINPGSLVGGSLSASGLASAAAAAAAGGIPPPSLTAAVGPPGLGAPGGPLGQSSLQGNPHVSTAPSVYSHLAAQPTSLQYSAQQLQQGGGSLGHSGRGGGHQGGSSVTQQQQQQSQQQQSGGAPQQKQRVFTGVVSKLGNDFGFVDEEVFFQLNVCKGSVPKVGDRVLVEAHYYPNMPFKWNASRIQVLPNQPNLPPQPNTAGAGAQVGSGGRSGQQQQQQHQVGGQQQQQQQQQQQAAALGVHQHAMHAAQIQAALHQQQQQQQALQQHVAASSLASQAASLTRFASPVNPAGIGSLLSQPPARSLNTGDLGGGGAAGRSRFDRDRERDRGGDRGDRNDRDKEIRMGGGGDRDMGGGRRERERGGERDRDRERDRVERERRPTPPPRKRSRTPRKKSRSPRRSPRRRAKPTPRYMVEVPKVNLAGKFCSVIDLKSRYQNMYIPSDFSSVKLRWTDTFTAGQPFKFPASSATFHIFNKEVESVGDVSSAYDPPDADPVFSAKVMLLSAPLLDDLYQRTCSLTEDQSDGRDDFHHPSRALQFLVGMRAKGEPMAIGGPWSPSLDGANPKEDPQVLINTAVRTTHALTGIDLGMCTQWYKFTELTYQRAEETRRGRLVPAHTETVVIFLPDVWNCVPSRVEWQDQRRQYQNKLRELLGEAPLPAALPPPQQQLTSSTDPDTSSENVANASIQEEDDSVKSMDGEGPKALDPTHHSKLDPKAMKVQELRDELDSRQLNSKGLKSQLLARLTKALKTEKDDEEREKKKDKAEGSESEVKTEEDVEMKEATAQEIYDLADEPPTPVKELSAADKASLEKLYLTPTDPMIMVHPSRTAKGGKFEVSVMSLSVLLDYRPEDNKEHSFEVSLFAEAFNEMLLRDFGFTIYKRLLALPAKKKDEKEKKEDKTSEDKDKKGGGSGEEKKVKEEKGGGSDSGSGTKEVKSELVIAGSGAKEKGEEETEPARKRKKTEGDELEKVKTEDGESRNGRTSASRDKDAKKKPQTMDKEGLLAFIYYDSTHTGYILDKDIESIFLMLGLGITRSQTKKLLSKAVQRDAVYYRKITDIEDEGQTLLRVPIPSDYEIMKERLSGSMEEEMAATSTSGGDPAAVTDSADTRLITHRGVLVNIDSVLQKLEENARSRAAADVKMKAMENELESLGKKQEETISKLTRTVSDLTDAKKTVVVQSRTIEDARSRYSRYESLLVRSEKVLGDLKEDIKSATAKTVSSSNSSSIKQEAVADEQRRPPSRVSSERERRSVGGGGGSSSSKSVKQEPATAAATTEVKTE